MTNIVEVSPPQENKLERLNIATSFFYILLIVASFLPFVKADASSSIIDDMTFFESVLYFVFLFGGLLSYLSGIGKYIASAFSFIIIAVFTSICIDIYQELSSLSRELNQFGLGSFASSSNFRDMLIDNAGSGFYLTTVSILMIIGTGFVNYEAQNGVLLALKKTIKKYLNQEKVNFIYSRLVKVVKSKGLKNTLVLGKSKASDLLKGDNISNLRNRFTMLNAGTKRILKLSFAVIITLSLIMTSSSPSIPNKAYVSALIEKELVGYSKENIKVLDVSMDDCISVDKENTRKNEVQCFVQYSYKWIMQTGGWLTGSKQTKAYLHEEEDTMVFYQVKVKGKWRWRMD